MSCERNSRKLPQGWRDILLNKYLKAPDRNAWADFNCAAAGYFAFQKGIRPDNYSILCEEDAPDFPNPEDFTDLEKERNCIRD